MTKVLIFGGTGMLGHKLCQILGDRFDVHATFRWAPPDVPDVYQRVRPVLRVAVEDEARVRAVLEEIRPDVVINAVGIVKQLMAASDPIACITVNALFPHQLARVSAAAGAKMIHISTDCVFSGARGSYRETDDPDPVDLYGRSKLLGEVNAPALTLRTSIIGREIGTRVGLVEWFLSQAGGTVRGFAHAIYTGLTTQALAEVIGDLIDRGVPLDGLWHVSTEPISKYDLLRMLDAAFGTRTRIEPDEAFHCDRSLDSSRFWSATGLAQPSWTDMIRGLREDRTPYDEMHRAAVVG